MMDDRIKLAEAMGWTPTSSYTSPSGEKEVSRWRDPETGTGGNCATDLPDPFIDANDDYAVLEWMRKHNRHMLYKFGEAHFNVRLSHAPTASGVPCYQIGDYARAALKVIE